LAFRRQEARNPISGPFRLRRVAAAAKDSDAAAISLQQGADGHLAAITASSSLAATTGVAPDVPSGWTKPQGLAGIPASPPTASPGVAGAGRRPL
jgi:hypothetical protein